MAFLAMLTYCCARKQVWNLLHPGQTRLPLMQRVHPGLVAHLIVYEQCAASISLVIGLHEEAAGPFIAPDRGQQVAHLLLTHAGMVLLAWDAERNRGTLWRWPGCGRLICRLARRPSAKRAHASVPPIGDR